MLSKLFKIHLMIIALSIILYPLLIGQTTTAQYDGEPAPQLLYRAENRLVLLDGYTGEATELPLEITERDRFSWSPDGRYLLAKIAQEEFGQFCLNLYEVDVEAWLYEDPISCGVQTAIFSNDSDRIIFVKDDENTESIMMFRVEAKVSEELYVNSSEDSEDRSDISRLIWSPTGSYLTFVSYHIIMGGSLNYFVVLNVETQERFTIQGGTGYYASYSPIWSDDDAWFLIRLKDEYVTNGVVTETNHEGDVYLVNSETGEQQRLTYTPGILEIGIRWTENGDIVYSVWRREDFRLTPEEALSVEVIPDEDIVTPEPVDLDSDRVPGSSWNVNVTLSPDPDIGYVYQNQSEDERDLIVVETLGNISPIFRVSIKPDDIVIGWRPSDYPYGRG